MNRVSRFLRAEVLYALSILRRNPVPVGVCLYALTLFILHLHGLFPRAGLHDLSRLIGGSVVTIEGRVISFPSSRWGRQQFIVDAHAVPLNAFNGRVLVNLPAYAPVLAPGDVVRLRGYLAAPASRDPAFDAPAYWSTRGVFSVLKVWRPEGCEVVVPVSPQSLAALSWSYRQQFSAFWMNVLADDQDTGLLLGITLGAKGMLSREMKQLCIRAGVYHIVVVSGQNMALIVSLGLAILRLLRVPPRWNLSVCAAPILFYAAVVGYDPPVARAALMAIAALVASALWRDVPRWHTLFLAAGWILLIEPASLFGASFQLSFAATACVLWALPWMEDKSVKPVLIAWILRAIVISLAIHVALWPLLVGYFHRLAWCGLFANWTVFPLAGVVMMAGLFLGSWGVVAPDTVPSFLIKGLGALLALLKWSIYWLAQAPASDRVWTLPAPGWLAAYYGTLFAILWLFHRRSHAQTLTSLPARRHRLQPR
jgi:competence protein ComEC